MPLSRDVFAKAVAVCQGLLGIAVETIGAVKRELAHLAGRAMDPLVRRRVDDERQRYEARQAEVDQEKLAIFRQAKRDGAWSAEARDRYEQLDRESKRIARALGPREAVKSAPDDYDVVLVDPEHMHRLEWHVGQATDKHCTTCSLPMLLHIRRDQVRDSQPGYFWGCTGWYLDRSDHRHCTATERVTHADLGVLLRRDNEALAMDRAEMCRRAFDKNFSRRIGQDLRELRGRAFPAYRCPIHDVAMVLMRKRAPQGELDVWHLKCPSPIPHNGGRGCQQTVKLKTVAQVLAVRHIGTGEIF